MSAELAPLVEEAKAIAVDAQVAFGHLRAEQLNWKPAPEAWSVAQCLDHLIRINSGYFPTLERIERGEHRPSWKERFPLLPRLFGALILKAVQPHTRHKAKAARLFRPSASVIEGDIVARFAAHQDEVIAHMERVEALRPSRVIVTSPVASFATYSLRDGFRILVAHERRHLAQARRVMEAEGFPAP